MFMLARMLRDQDLLTLPRFHSLGGLICSGSQVYRAVMDTDKLDRLKQLEAEIETLRIKAQYTPEAFAWYSKRLDRLELLCDIPRLTT